MSRLDELEALEQRATPGLWTAGAPRPFGGNTPVVVPDDLDSDRWIIDALEPADAELIVALRNAAPALLRVVRAARAFTAPERIPPWPAGQELDDAMAALEGGGHP